MVGTKYLSEVIDISKLHKRDLNIIKAPTGCGKTWFALNTIGSLCENAYHQAVYLIDTINGRDQIKRRYKNVSSVNWEWINIVADDGIWFEEDKRIAIMSYHRFGMILAENLDFCNKFEYIICDEMHSLIHYRTFEKRPNSCTIALSGIKKAVLNDRTTVIALTATPNAIIENFFADHNDEIANAWYEVPIDQSDLRHYEPKRVEPFTNIREVLRVQKKDQTGIVFMEHVKPMKQVEAFAKEHGFSPISFWSTANTDHIMTVEQLEARRSVIEDSVIPSKYNLLIINKSSETSIKIESQVDYMIINNSTPDTQIQVRGRVSNDLEVLYLPADDNVVIVVPDRFLNRSLSSTQTEELCEALNIRRRGNSGYYKWRTIRDYLTKEDSGYQVIHERRDSRHYYTIKLSELETSSQEYLNPIKE